MAAGPGAAAIAVAGLHKRFPGVHALAGIDLEVGQGEFFGLLGPNGAGKSTLIHILAGLARASAGTARVMGHDVVRDYRASRRALGVVPQELVFDPFFTVREVLRIQAGYFGLGRAHWPWIESLMAVLALDAKADTNLRALSGGMKRRVMIAQALVHRPPVVILDEPTAGVDVDLRRSLWEFIRGLHREGHTIILTTHYLEEAEQLCERIAILNRGVLIAVDRREALLARGIGRRLRLNVTTETPLATVPGALRDRVSLQEGARLVLELDRDRDSVVGVLDALRDHGARIVDVATEAADLEDVFLELTGRGRVS
jgi:ABC-2 type transport system ATP-binding protein